MRVEKAYQARHSLTHFILALAILCGLSFISKPASAECGYSFRGATETSLEFGFDVRDCKNFDAQSSEKVRFCLANGTCANTNASNGIYTVENLQPSQSVKINIDYRRKYKICFWPFGCSWQYNWKTQWKNIIRTTHAEQPATPRDLSLSLVSLTKDTSGKKRNCARFRLQGPWVADFNSSAYINGLSPGERRFLFNPSVNGTSQLIVGSTAVPAAPDIHNYNLCGFRNRTTYQVSVIDAYRNGGVQSNQVEFKWR